MKQTARIHHRKATSSSFLSGPGIVSLASSLIGKQTNRSEQKKTPTRPNDFSTWLYPLSIRKRISPHKQFNTLSEIHWTVMHKHNSDVRHIHVKSKHGSTAAPKECHYESWWNKNWHFFKKIHLFILLWVMIDVVYQILAKEDRTTLIMLLKFWHKWAKRIW